MSERKDTNLERREFIGQGAKLAAGLTIAPGVVLFGISEASVSDRPDDQPASSNQRWGMLIDSTKCATGCDKCVTACADENGWGDSEPNSSPAQKAQWMRKVELRHLATGKTHSLPMMCQHCENPPCVDVCPTNASMKRVDGIVLVDRHRCIGCRYCMMACPYKARSFIHETLTDQKPHMPRGKGCVESCTMCVHRVDDGRQPACVESCPEQAIVFGDLKDPNSAISQALRSYDSTAIREDLGLNPGVRYRGI